MQRDWNVLAYVLLLTGVGTSFSALPYSEAGGLTWSLRIPVNATSVQIANEMMSTILGAAGILQISIGVGCILAGRSSKK